MTDAEAIAECIKQRKENAAKEVAKFRAKSTKE